MTKINICYQKYKHDRDTQHKGKVKYKTKEDAIKYINRMIKKGSMKRPFVNIYNCYWCNRWHFGGGKDKDLDQGQN